MGIVGLVPKQMPDQPDLVLYHMQAPKWWGLYLVRPYERVIFIDNGKAVKVLEGGRHVVGRFPVVGVVDVIWIALKNFKTGFYAEAYSQESIQLKFWGFAIIKIADIQSFINNVVGSQRVYTQDSLSNWIRGQLISVIRSRTAGCTYTDYISDRSTFINLMRTETEKLMFEYGLKITTVEIERIKIPEDLEQTLKEGVQSGIQVDVLRRKGAAVSDVYKEITKAGVNPATIEFFKTMTGRDMSEVFYNLGISPQEAIRKARDQAKNAGLLGPGGLSSHGTGSIDLILSLFAMQMLQNMSGVSFAKPTQPSGVLPALQDTKKCSKCDEPMPTKARFCPSCGASVAQAKHCTKCGTLLPIDAKYCPACGSQTNIER